jgi:hypothetical protein
LPGRRNLTLRALEPGLCFLVLAFERRSRAPGVERGPVRLATKLEIVPGRRLCLCRGVQLPLRLPESVERGLILRAWLDEFGADRLPHLVVDPLIRPDAADQQEDRKDDDQQLLALRRLDVLDLDACAHLESPLLVLGRSSTLSSQSSASAIRMSVSMRGGRPPDSRRAIADCVVPVSSASSACERFRARRRSATCSAIAAKSHP